MACPSGLRSTPRKRVTGNPRPRVQILRHRRNRPPVHAGKGGFCIYCDHRLPRSAHFAHIPSQLRAWSGQLNCPVPDRRRRAIPRSLPALRIVSRPTSAGWRTKREAELFAATVEVSKAKVSTSPPLGRMTVGELATDSAARKQQACAPRTTGCWSLPGVYMSPGGGRR